MCCKHNSMHFFPFCIFDIIYLRSLPFFADNWHCLCHRRIANPVNQRTVPRTFTVFGDLPDLPPLRTVSHIPYSSGSASTIGCIAETSPGVTTGHHRRPLTSRASPLTFRFLHHELLTSAHHQCSAVSKAHIPQLTITDSPTTPHQYERSSRKSHQDQTC